MQNTQSTVSHTHLHVHSSFTLLGGTATIPDLVNQAVADGLPALALTDSNALYGAVTFRNACTEAGIQPLMGMTINVAAPTEAAPLVLLARNADGWRSLCRLSSILQNHPDRLTKISAGVSLADLQANRAGLLCLMGGRRGRLERLLRTGQEHEVSRWIARLAGIFGETSTFLSLELHGPDDVEIANAVTALGQRYGLPTVAVQPVYTLQPEDRADLRLLAAIDRNTTLEALSAQVLPDNGDEAIDLHWLGPAEMAQRFAPFQDALARTNEIARLCEPCLPDGRPIWPVAEGERDRERDREREGAGADGQLARLAEAGLRHRFGRRPDEAVDERLERELHAIADHGFAPLFLLVAEIVKFARLQEIPLSTRGSVANSLVAYCLDISDVNPMEHDLLFERFLNPARTELPDIDLDFCSRRRDEVLTYVQDRFGADRVALVATVSTFRAKSAVRETAKAFGLSEIEAGNLTKRIRREWHPDPRRRHSTEREALLASATDPRHKEILRQAWRLLGLPHHLSVHPGGLVVTPGPLTDYVPLQHAPKGFPITQFDHKDVETLGLVKVDILGIRALTVLADAAALVRQHHDPSFRLAHIPSEDPVTGQLLARAETVGVFQCESTGAQRTLRQLKARSPQDLAVANAFFKPGPATGGMANAFVRRYRGEEPASYLHPALEPILRTTKGVLLFQEQILRLATEIAGLGWEEAEHLRRGMSKFRADEMERIRSRFVEGCQRSGGPGLSAQQATTLWEQVAAFAGYGFNQGHATAYAAVSYRSAWLKAHYPAEFLCARLADWGGFHHQAVYIAEVRKLGIAVQPPHVNVSGRKFTLRYGTIQSGNARSDVAPNGSGPRPALYVGLSQIRDLRRASQRAIIAERENGPYHSLRDLLLRVSLQPKEVEHLIRCGGLDGMGTSRAALLAEYQDIQRAGSAGQMGFDFGGPAAEAETIRERITWETTILGLPVSEHPLGTMSRPLDAVPIHALPETGGGIQMVAGVRLPGWTGGKGFFLDDGNGYAVTVLPESMAAPDAWHPVLVTGRWRTDSWGGGWLQAEAIREPGE